MKRVPLTLFLSLLCIANSELSAARVDIHDLLEDSAHDIDTQNEGPRKPTQSPSLRDRWRDFSFRDLFTGRGKKKPATSQSTSPSDISSTSPSDISIDMPNDSADITRNVVDLKYIEHLKGDARKRFGSDISTDGLQGEAQKTVQRIYKTSLVVKKALSSINATDQEKVALLESEFEKARTALINAINDNRSHETLLDTYNEKLMVLITEISKVKTQETVTEAEAKIDNALTENKFAQIEDTDDATQKVYKQWKTAIQQVAKALEKPQSDETLTTESIELNDAQAATLEQTTALLIKAIKASKHSKAAQMNWKFKARLATVLKKAEALNQEAQKALAAGRAFQKGDQQAFNELLEGLNRLDGQTLTSQQQADYLDTGGWFTKAKTISFKTTLEKMKAILKKMKTTEQVKKDTAEEDRFKAAQEEQKKRIAAEEKAKKEREEAREKKEIATIIHLWQGILESNFTEEELGKLSWYERDELKQLAHNSSVIDRVMVLAEADSKLTQTQKDALKALQKAFIDTRMEYVTKLKGAEATGRRKYNDASLNALITQLRNDLRLEPFPNMITDGNNRIQEALTSKDFVEIKDTSTATQTAYYKYDEIVHNKTHQWSDHFATDRLEWQLNFEKALATLIKAIEDDTPSPEAKKHWEEVQKLNATFAEALEKINKQVAELEEQAKEKFFKDLTDKSTYNALIEKIKDFNIKSASLDKKAWLSSEHSLKPFEVMIEQLKAIVGRMETLEQINKSIKASLFAQYKKNATKDLAVLKKTGYFTDQELAAFKKQIEEGEFDAKRALYDYVVKPKLEKWYDQNRIIEIDKHSESGRAYIEKYTELLDATNRFINGYYHSDYHRGPRSFRNCLKNLKKIQKMAEKYDIPSFPL